MTLLWIKARSAFVSVGSSGLASNPAMLLLPISLFDPKKGVGHE
jgi:hypothetical protein